MDDMERTPVYDQDKSGRKTILALPIRSLAATVGLLDYDRS
jgi:hypothetical protein